MTMKDLSRKTDAELDELYWYFARRENWKVCRAIHDVQKYYHKRVRVVKGRKVPLGTTGECFWMGQYDNSKYGDPWGIYTTTRIGIRDDDGGVHWTALSNVELA